MQDTPKPDLAAAFRPHFEKAADGACLSEDEAREALEEEIVRYLADQDHAD